MLFGGQRFRALSFPAREFGLGLVKFAPPLLPFGFQAAGNEAIFRRYRPITAFGLVVCPFDR